MCTILDKIRYIQVFYPLRLHDTQDNDVQQNDTLHQLSIMTISTAMKMRRPAQHYAECTYTDCHFAAHRYDECHYTESRSVELRYTECSYPKCHYAECHSAECYTTPKDVLKLN